MTKVKIINKSTRKIMLKELGKGILGVVIILVLFFFFLGIKAFIITSF